MTPVLALGEVADHPHVKARGTIVAPGRGAAGRARPAVLAHRPRRCPVRRREPEDVETVLADWAR